MKPKPRGKPRTGTSVHLPEGPETRPGSLREGLERLIETVPAVVYIAELGVEGRWLYVSPQISDLLGYQPGEWSADRKIWSRSLHPDDRVHACSFEDEKWIDEEGIPPTEYRLKARDGHYVWVLERARLVLNENGGPPLWYGVMQNISALKQAQETLATKAEQQALTARLGEAAIGTEEQDELIVLAVDALTEMTGIIDAEIWERDDAGKIHLRHRSNWTGPPLTFDFEPDKYPGAQIARGETVMINDWETDARMAEYAEHRVPRVASTMIVPIAGAQRQFGFLCVHASVPNRFSEQDENFLRAATSLIGSAIDRSKVENSLRHRLLHDGLTELPNRELFTERLQQAIAESHGSGRMMAVLFLDIDHFKLINDGIGHHVGDETLREVGPRLLSGMRPGDTVARFGGDEFGMVVRSVESGTDALGIAERLLELLSSPIKLENSEIVISASVGVSVFDPRSGRGKTAESLLREADAAMHKAKSLGRAQVQLFDQPLRDNALNRLEIERGLRLAIERDELVLHYQPFVSLPEGQIIGFEALVRWRHPDRGLIGPSEFIPIAEESGLINRVDSWVLTEAARQTAEWDSIIPVDHPFSVSVNASARQLSRTKLPDLVNETLDRNHLAPERLALEITETTLISAVSVVPHVLNSLHEIGIGIALDDFGTGFSSLSYLSQFPLDVIKIDRMFIDQLSTGDPTGSAITDAIIQIGKALSMTVVAEGVSTPTQMRMVRDLGCRVVQGFLISEPIAAERADVMLKESLSRFPSP